MNIVSKKKEILILGIVSKVLLHLIYIYIYIYIKVRYILQNEVRKIILDFLKRQSSLHNRLRREREVEEDNEKFTVSKNNIYRERY